MNKSIIMPLFYHGRLKGNTDKLWIMKRMFVIPDDKKQEVADEYTQIYLKNGVKGRELANKYLHKLAVEYRDKLNGKQ